MGESGFAADAMVSPVAQKCCITMTRITGNTEESHAPPPPLRGAGLAPGGYYFRKKVFNRAKKKIYFLLNPISAAARPAIPATERYHEGNSGTGVLGVS